MKIEYKILVLQKFNHRNDLKTLTDLGLDDPSFSSQGEAEKHIKLLLSSHGFTYTIIPVYTQ